MTNLIDKLDELHARVDGGNVFLRDSYRREVGDELVRRWPAIARALRAAEELEGALDPKCWCEGISGEEVCPACKYREALDALKGGE